MSLTIPATWTQPAGCLATNDLYGYENPTGYFVDVLGAPSQTSSCYPSGYQATTSGPMYATACPDGFTSAGTVDSNSQLTVCCPSAYAFLSSTITFNDYTMMCASEWTSSTTITFTWLSFEDEGASTATEYAVTSSGTAGTTVQTTSVKLATEERLSGRALHAMGIQISSTSASSTTTPSSTTTSLSTTDPEAQSSGNSDSSLSPGAAAGIGVGCTIAVMLLALGFWLMYRRGLNNGRKIREAKESPSTPPLEDMDTTNPSYSHNVVLEHKTPIRHEAWVPWNLELDGRSPPSELESGRSRVELP